MTEPAKNHFARTVSKPAGDLRTDYRRVVPSASVYIGRHLCGFLIDGDHECVALNPDRDFVGLFPDRTSARLAILLLPRREV